MLNSTAVAERSAGERAAGRRAAAGLLAAWFTIVATPLPAQAPELDLSWLDRSALENGAVELRLEKLGRVTLVYTAVLVDAPPSAIWDVLVACDIAPEYVPHVVACRSLEIINEGRSEFFVQTVKPAFFIPSFEHVFRMDYDPYNTIDVSRVSGPIKQLAGRWWLLEEQGGHVLLAYTLALDPGIPIPRMFVRATLRRDLPTVLSAVKERAEDAAARLGDTR